jgi:hypothetical protein
MSLYTRRVQTTLTEEQFVKLSQIAVNSNKTVGALIREALEDVYFVPKQRQLRLKALKKLLSLDAPVAEWQRMEEEIGRYDSLDWSENS